MRAALASECAQAELARWAGGLKKNGSKDVAYRCYFRPTPIAGDPLLATLGRPLEYRNALPRTYKKNIQNGDVVESAGRPCRLFNLVQQ